MFFNPMSNRHRRRRRNRRGATAVEFALVAPAFMIVVTICVEFARLSMLRSVAQNACYEASRLVVTEGATVQDGIDRANQILGRLGNVQADISINGSDGSLGEDGNVTNEIAFDTEAVQTQISIGLKDNTLIIPGNMFGEKRIGAQITLRTERYRGFFDSTLSDAQ